LGKVGGTTENLPGVILQKDDILVAAGRDTEKSGSHIDCQGKELGEKEKKAGGS